MLVARPTYRDQIRLFFSLGALLLAAAHVRWPQIFDQIALLLVLIALLPWIVPFIRENFSRIEVFGAKIDFVEKQLSEARETIDRFIFLSMPRPIYDNLKRLADARLTRKSFGKFEATEGFKQQLRSLRDSGYIDTHGRLIGQLTSDQELSEFAEVTKLGLDFIKYRESLDTRPVR
jgi:hypothetical protein